MGRDRRRKIAEFCKRVAMLQGLNWDHYYMLNVAPVDVLASRFERYKVYFLKHADERASVLLAELGG